MNHQPIALSLILPVYNQANIIEPVFIQIYKTIQNLRTPYEIILVENGSTDGTEKVTAGLAKKYTHTQAIRTTKGYGSAVLSGLEKSQGEYICYMPSDGQIDLSVLPVLWKNRAFDIVKIKRINRENIMRVLVSKFFSLILAIRFHTPLVDINGSPRIFKRQAMLSLNLAYRDSFIDAEMLVKAHRRGWKILEIPMKNLPRYGGESSRSWKTFAEFLKNIYLFKI